MDTEFESSRRGQLLCLIQVSTGTETFLVDAIRLRDLHPLGAVLGAAGSEWVRVARELQLRAGFC
jgi:ribonuclease D